MFGRSRAPAAKFVEGRVGYAVGDIHGRADLLGALLADIERRALLDVRNDKPPLVMFLGDYIDRGPDTAGVIELLLTGRPANCECRYLRGNHEQAMAAFIEDPIKNRRWIIHGGAETMLSYGVTPPAPVGAKDDDLSAAAHALAAALPLRHRQFLDNLERYVEFGDYVFVHAGVDLDRPLDQQTDGALYWARERFIGNKKRFSHKVVHGHTPSERPYVDDRRVGIDTGAYASGKLTAARFEGEEVSFFAAIAQGAYGRPMTKT